MDAIRAYTSAEALVRNEDDETAELFYKLSQAYAALSPKELEKPLDYARKAFEIHKKMGSRDLVIMDLLNMAYINHNGGNQKESISSVDTALNAANELGDESLVSTCMMSKADMLSSKSSGKKEAGELYHKASDIAEKNGIWDNYFEAQYGLLEIKRGKDGSEAAFSEALELLDRVDKVCSQIKNKKERGDFRKSLSYLYDFASDIAMELENVEEAIKIAQRLREQ
ncbi:MAG: hypothetical protein M1162_03180 [Candidatus Thermoplasmatota archaeon]|nr:hypothetical protein [Candidatus Thermoplasmatota archaeon]